MNVRGSTSKPVERPVDVVEWSTFSALPESDRVDCLRQSQELTDGLYEGLDVTSEMEAVRRQSLGDSVLVWSGSRLAAFAVCHVGPRTEAGSDTCFVKFGAARGGPDGARAFQRLLTGCEDFAAQRSASRLTAGVNTGRHEAYRSMLAYGFRSDMLGVAMQRPNEPGYNRPDVFAIDDWR